jgi:hypothetical protein
MHSTTPIDCYKAARCAVCGGHGPDGSGCEFCPAVDQNGDIDPNGDLVDVAQQLAGRMRGTVGPSTIDLDEHLLLVTRTLVERGLVDRAFVRGASWPEEGRL